MVRRLGNPRKGSKVFHVSFAISQIQLKKFRSDLISLKLEEARHKLEKMLDKENINLWSVAVYQEKIEDGRNHRAFKGIKRYTYSYAQHRDIEWISK